MHKVIELMVFYACTLQYFVHAYNMYLIWAAQLL